MTSFLESSELYGSTKLTVSLAGIVEGVGGRGCIKDRGVLGGSKLGIVLFHACTKVWSST